MKHHFDGLRLPSEDLADREDADFDFEEQGKEHRVKVCAALRQAMHDTLVARYVDALAHGIDPDETDGFHEEFWNPMWDGLRDSLTRQDLLRWLIDWAHQAAQEQAMATVERMNGELELLDDDSGAWWLTQNPG